MSAKSKVTAAATGSKYSATQRFYEHSRAERVNTDATITRALKLQYPELELTVVPERSDLGTYCDLLGFAAAGNAEVTEIDDTNSGPGYPSISWKVYVPPARRLDGGKGLLGDSVMFGKYMYRWEGDEFIVYLVDGRDGVLAGPEVRNYYVLSTVKHRAESLILAAGSWGTDLHEEAWVFDSGFWDKSQDLWRSAQKSTWDAVILDEDMKQALINDHESFFNSQETYKELQVPWKRGIIYHGPPGNGKTISIKATMHMLWDRKPRVPTLYVRSLESFMGPEYSISSIFQKAREFAPCYLVLEDIDTIITDEVRSYFLNEVDGMKANDGIFIVASTNHLDRLDPGIAKRPSRFDRKYYFPDPNVDQREAYCHFWQRKLRDNEEIEFPDKMCRAIAEITDKFSFAYMQEAFVAALLAIAREDEGKEGARRHSDTSWVLVGDEGSDDGSGDGLGDLKLWVEMKKQVAILREGMDEGDDKRK